MGLTEAELIEAVKERLGTSVSPRQVRRMREHGLLPTPQHAHPPGLSGSTSLVPASTVEQVARIIELRGEARNDERVLLRLWWEGFPVARDDLRALLLAPLLQAGAEIREALERHQGDVVETAKFLAGYLLPSFKSDAKWALQRRRLTARADELWDALVATWMQLLGDSPGWDVVDVSQEHSPAEVLEQLTGIERARTDPLTGERGWLSDGLSFDDVFADLTRWLAGQEIFDALVDRIEGASEAELDWARDDVRWLGEVFGGFVDRAESRFGFDAGGLAELSSLANPLEAHQFALVSVLGLELRGRLVRPLAPAGRASRALSDAFLRGSG